MIVFYGICRRCDQHALTGLVRIVRRFGRSSQTSLAANFCKCYLRYIPRRLVSLHCLVPQNFKSKSAFSRNVGFAPVHKCTIAHVQF